MEKETKNYEVNWDDIKFTTEMSGEMILCKISFDYTKYTLKKDSIRGYSKDYYGTDYTRIVVVKKFDLEMEKALVREIVCTRDYRRELEKQKKNLKEHKL